MRKNKLLSEEEKINILIRREHSSLGKIAEELKINKGTIYYFIKKYEKAHSIQRIPPPGRPKPSKNVLKKIRNYILRHPRATRNKLIMDLNIKLSTRTLSQYLHDLGFQFFLSQQIFGGYSANNQVQVISTWQDFVFQTNTKITFTQKTQGTLSFLEYKVRYLALLTKDSLAANERLLDYNNVEVPTSRYIELNSHNPFTFNGVRFTNILIKDRIADTDNSLSFNIKSTQDHFQFAMQGVPVHINSDDPARNGDIGIFMSRKSDNSSDNANFMITNFDGTNFLVNAPAVNNVVNDAIVLESIEYTTKILKSENAALTTCGTVTLVLILNVYNFQIFSERFNARKIAQGQGFEGKFTYSTNSFKGQVPNFQDLTVSHSIVISFCNLDVSPINKFRVTEVIYYFKDKKTPYYDYFLTDTQVFKDITSVNTYTAGIISAYSFENTRVSYGDIILTVTLDNEVFRNMIMTIKADLSSIQIDPSIAPNFLPYFGTLGNPHNTLWETCVVDLKSGTITITTFNEIRVFEPIENSFNILINPTLISNLDKITWTIQQRFNNLNDQNVVLSSEEAREVHNNSAKFALDKFAPMEISSILQYKSIEPYFPNISGIINLKLNFLNDLSVKAYIDNNKIVVNTIRLHFQINYYGPIPKNLICYLNQVKIDNCISDKENIYIRTTIDPTINVNIGIYGYRVPESNKISILNSTVLVSLSYMQTFSRKVYFYGKVRLPDAFDPTLYVLPSTTNVANLRIMSQEYKTFFPGEATDVTVSMNVDNVDGLATSTPFSHIDTLFGAIDKINPERFFYKFWRIQIQDAYNIMRGNLFFFSCGRVENEHIKQDFQVYFANYYKFAGCKIINNTLL